MGEVYAITNIRNGMKYVGQTMRTGLDRFLQFSSGSKPGRTSLLRKAFDEFGEESFVVETLEMHDDRETLLAREYFWIGELNSIQPNGYNRVRLLPSSSKSKVPRSVSGSEGRSERRSKKRKEKEKPSPRPNLKAQTQMLRILSTDERELTRHERLAKRQWETFRELDSLEGKETKRLSKLLYDLQMGRE